MRRGTASHFIGVEERPCHAHVAVNRGNQVALRAQVVTDLRKQLLPAPDVGRPVIAGLDAGRSQVPLIIERQPAPDLGRAAGSIDVKVPLRDRLSR